MDTLNSKENTFEMTLTDSITCSAKYIFMDIVGFSRERHLDAQSTIIKELNRIVLESIQKNGVTDLETNCIFIPTGDGICVALINNESYDVHMRTALDILALLDEYNNQTNDEVYKFEVRIGINANEDNLIKDINNRTNLAGAGITLAQRIMDKADGNQILVGQSVCASLGQHRKYWKLFKEHQTEDKHGNPFLVHQYQGTEHAGLNLETPRSVDKSSVQITTEAKLNEDIKVAYYFAHAINEEQLLRANQDNSWAGMVLLWFLAIDSEGKSKTNEYQEYKPISIKTGSNTPDTQLISYRGININLMWKLALYIRDVELSKYKKFFVPGEDARTLVFINDLGREKLKQECPEIWNEFGLDNPS